MAGRRSTGGLSELDYETVFTALASTVKGRQFLAAYLERNRPDDVRRLVGAMTQIEESVSAVRETLQPRQIATDLLRIAARLDGSPGTRAARSDLVALASALTARGPARK